MWAPDPSVSVSLKGGFGGFVVRHTGTDALGYFKIRNFRWDIICSRLGALVGLRVPETELARVGERNGAVSHFWGAESIDVMRYQGLHGQMPPSLAQATGFLAFAWWLGYGDLRNEHLLWSPIGFALIDYDDVFSWRYHALRHLIGPAILLKHFDASALRSTAERIGKLTEAQILSCIVDFPKEFRFRDSDEERFTKRFYEEAQRLPETIGRYWERGVASRDLPELELQDRNLWLKIPWRKQVEVCPHRWSPQGALWKCGQCQFYWPLLGDPE